MISELSIKSLAVGVAIIRLELGMIIERMFETLGVIYNPDITLFEEATLLRVSKFVN